MQVPDQIEVKNPLVSVVVISYNSSNFILETLESIKAQTYENIELIVSDDCSKDDTVSKCNEWINFNKDRFVEAKTITSSKNTGIAQNLNRGIQATKGPFIKYIAGDDVLIENCIERYMQEIKLDPTKLVMYSGVEKYMNTFEAKNKLPDQDFGAFRMAHPDITAQEQFEILLRANYVTAGSLFFSKQIFDQVGLFDASLRYWEDFPMLIKLTQNGIKIHYIDFISYRYRIHRQSVQVSQRSDTIFSAFLIEKEKYCLEHYVEYLPWFERVIRKIMIYRVLLLDKLGFNKSTWINRKIVYISEHPWKTIFKMIINKYKY